jgi:hypothetical protein
MVLNIRNTTTDQHYSRNEIARAIVNERLMKAEKEPLAKGTQIRRKLQDVVKGIFRN